MLHRKNVYQLFVFFVVLMVLTGGSGSMQAQNSNEKQIKKQYRDSVRMSKNFRWSLLGGPGYTPDFGVLLGASGLFTFKVNPKDTIQKRSVIPINLAYYLKGGASVTTRPQFFFKEDKYRLFGTFVYKSLDENYYGVGFETNKNIQRSDSTTKYKMNGFQIFPTFYFRMGSSDFFLGPWMDIQMDRWEPMEKSAIYNDPDFLAQSKGGVYDAFNVGVGVELSYDTRDIPSNAYSGIRFSLSGGFYSKAFGGDRNYGDISLDYRQFEELKFLGERRILAWMVQSFNKIGDVPISQMPGVGSPFDLRGFYKGQFRDKTSTMALLEYRHMINTDKSNRIKRMLHHFGFVAWGGVGLMGPDPASIEGVLPNFGAGLRIELLPRSNFRLDVGYDPINKKSLLYMNITEAF